MIPVRNFDAEIVEILLKKYESLEESAGESRNFNRLTIMYVVVVAEGRTSLSEF